jgi:D-glycero-alpha-D-manno-heptose-7-phosphate kinase
MCSAASATPIRRITAVAPIRICDNGGWTDTWFAERGCIFNIGVYPYAEVQVEVWPREAQADRVVLCAENYGERYVVTPEGLGWDRHPLLEAAIRRMGVPEDVALGITVFSEAPAGASTGTSAAVTVALIGALDRLTPGRLTAHEVATTAHAVETEMLGQQCGIQDQLCSAYGGINYIEMHRYPHAAVSPVQVPNAIWWELERRLALVYLGKSHSSSAVHAQVIRELKDSGADCAKLEDLRRTAPRSKDALCCGDFEELGRAMTDNTEAQARLHGELVGADARRVIDIARSFGAVGWKVNGAGGDGGSVTILAGGSSLEKRAMVRRIEESNPLYKSIPVYLSRFGLRVWEMAVTPEGTGCPRQATRQTAPSPP